MFKNFENAIRIDAWKFEILDLNLANNETSFKNEQNWMNIHFNIVYYCGILLMTLECLMGL